MTSDDPNRTVHAQQAFELTEVFAYKFGHVHFGQARPRRLKLLEPDVSTAGGKRARQSMVLVADEGDGGNLVIGFIDAPARIAELRSYNVLRSSFQARYSAEIDLKREEYDALLDDLRSFLKIQRFDPKIVDTAAGPQPQKKPAAATSNARAARPDAAASTANVNVMLAMLSIGILIGFAIGYIVFELL